MSSRRWTDLLSLEGEDLRLFQIFLWGGIYNCYYYYYSKDIYKIYKYKILNKIIINNFVYCKYIVS